jgi:hypothetical protein
MAGRHNKTPAPRCTAKLKDRSSCRTAAKKGDELCACHLRLESEQAEAPEQIAEAAPELADEGSGETAPESTSEHEEQLVSRTCERNSPAAHSMSTRRGALLDSLNAERDAYVICPHCRKRHRVVVRDFNARVNAVKTLLEQGFGKPQSQRSWRRISTSSWSRSIHSPPRS